MQHPSYGQPHGILLQMLILEPALVESLMTVTRLMSMMTRVQKELQREQPRLLRQSPEWTIKTGKFQKTFGGSSPNSWYCYINLSS